MNKKNKRFGRAFIVRTHPNGGYTAWFNSVERGKLSKRGRHVEFTKLYTHCFLFRWLKQARKLTLT